LKTEPRSKARARAMVSRPKDGSHLDAFANFALEEALYLENEGLLLRVWENEESVIIGRAQLAEFETDVAYCEENRIPIVRRFTAGGAVYNGPGNINWSLFVSRAVHTPSLRYVSDPRAVFRVASVPLLSALSSLDVKAHLEPPNSIVTSAGKVSGMAAYVSRDGFLCHGTLLTSADLQRVKSLTTPSPQPLERRYTRSRDVKTANSKLDSDSFIHTLVTTIGDETGLKLEYTEPTEGEESTARRLLREKYSKDAWNLGDPFADAGRGPGR